MTITDKDESYSIIKFEQETDQKATELRMSLMEDLSVFVDGYKFSPKYRAGVWDGKKYYFNVLKDMSMQIPKGLVGTILKRFKDEISEPYTPLRIPEAVTREEILEHVKIIGMPFEPYDYQIDAVLESFNNPRSILLSATGSGKSAIIYIIMTLHARKKRRGLLIVPNVGLAEQMKSDFTSYGMKPEDLEKHFHTIYSGKEKNFNKLMTVTTWQSAILMNNNDFNILDYVLVDEAHLSTGESLQKLLANSKNCLWKIGLTGTLPKTYEGRYTLTATLGKSVRIITPQGLIERGLATPVTIVTCYLNYSSSDKAQVKKFKNYQKEVKFLEEHYQRNEYIAKMVIQATEKFGNSLVMYNSISHGDFLLELILMKKFGIETPVVLEKVTPKKVEVAKNKCPDGNGLFVLTGLSEKDMKNLRKVYTQAEIQNIKVLGDYHIYLIKGSIEGEMRNEIRALLENSGPEIIDFHFGNQRLSLHEDVEMKLSNGEHVLAKNATIYEDFSEEWLFDSFGMELRESKPTKVQRSESAILIGSGATVSTGMNIKRLHNFFSASSTKSSIRLNQSIGRGMRLHDEKEMLRYFDFIDDFSITSKTGRVTNKNYTLKHSYERLNEYIDGGFPIKEIEVNFD